MALTDKNLYAYCDNNPIMRVDNGGEFWHIVVGGIVGAAISCVAQVVSNVVSGKPIEEGLLVAALSGAASGALAASGVGLPALIAGNTAISMAENAANQIIENEGFDNFDAGEMLSDGVLLIERRTISANIYSFVFVVLPSWRAI